MQHMRIATYGIIRGTFPEIADAAEKGLVPKFQAQPGFISYGVADVGEQKFVSLTMWETREEAQTAVATAASWVRDNLSDRVELQTNYVGDLAFFHKAPVAV